VDNNDDGMQQAEKSITSVADTFNRPPNEIEQDSHDEDASTLGDPSMDSHRLTQVENSLASLNSALLTILSWLEVQETPSVMVTQPAEGNETAGQAEMPPAGRG